MTKFKFLFSLSLLIFIFTPTKAQDWLPLSSSSWTPLYRTGSLNIGLAQPAKSIFQVGQVSNQIDRFNVGSAYLLNCGSRTLYGTSYIGFNTSYNSGTGKWEVSSDGGSNGGSAIYGTVGGSIMFVPFKGTGGTASQVGQEFTTCDFLDKQAMEILGDGRVRIGNVQTDKTGYPTLATNYKLYVERGIITEKIKVAVATTNDWADYVFNKNYTLLSIYQLQDYISQNKHLPNIPSAQKMQENGNDLGKTDVLLLEKIEELTLYIIDLQKQIDALKKQ